MTSESHEQQQELWFEAVASDEELSADDKVHHLLITCRDYWGRIEALERALYDLARVGNSMYARLLLSITASRELGKLRDDPRKEKEAALTESMFLKSWEEAVVHARPFMVEQETKESL